MTQVGATLLMTLSTSDAHELAFTVSQDQYPSSAAQLSASLPMSGRSATLLLLPRSSAWLADSFTCTVLLSTFAIPKLFLLVGAVRLLKVVFVLSAGVCPAGGGHITDGIPFHQRW